MRRKLLPILTLVILSLTIFVSPIVREPRPVSAQLDTGDLIPPIYMPFLTADFAVVSLTGFNVSPASPVTVKANQNHHIDVDATISTSKAGALVATLYQGSNSRDNDCRLLNPGTTSHRLGLDVVETSTGTKSYTVEARFKPGAATCQENGRYIDAVAAAAYHINWQDPCIVQGNSGLLRNGTFEEGWTDVNGSIQKANFWDISWVNPGQVLYDESSLKALAEPEFTHKLDWQLPPNERPCGSDPLILDGMTVYKIFHDGGSFGGELRQVVTGLTPGRQVKLTVPILLIRRPNDDVYGPAAGVWLNGVGDWLWAAQLGQRNWNYITRQVTVPPNGQVEVLIRLKSKWVGADFFLDGLKLEYN